MIIGWLIGNVLWMGLALLAASALSGRRLLAGLGWVLFGRPLAEAARALTGR